jgi:hypothetical protein
MVREERKSKNETARFSVRRAQNPAILNSKKPQKQTHIQSVSRCSRPTDDRTGNGAGSSNALRPHAAIPSFSS